MSHAKAQQSVEKSPINLSSDAEAAIEAKRETVERVANSEYPIADLAQALLEVAEE